MFPRRCKALALCALGWLTLVLPAGATNLISNGSFDSDLTGWSSAPVPNSTFAWDAFGNPQGSLRITSSAEYVWAETFGPCLVLAPGIELYEIAGGAYAVGPGAQCRVEFAQYLSTDCSGPRASGGLHVSPSQEWESQTYTMAAAWGYASMRPALINVRTAGPETACHFDNIRVYPFGAPALVIPTADARGLALLAAAIALAGASVLGRRS